MDANKSSHFDLLSIGDATVDIFLTLNNIDDKCRLNKEKNELCIAYGEKILVDNSEFMLGGNACNVVVGAARLGLNSAFISELGNDEFAQIVFKGLKKENVNVSSIKQTEDLETNFAIIITFQEDKVLFARHIPRKHDFSLENISANWIYLTSMGKEWKQAYQIVFDYIKQTGAKLAFNPGTTQIKEGIESFKEAIELADVLFLNKQEAGEISNLKDQPRLNRGQISKTENETEFIKQLLTYFNGMGSKTVVITDNNNGSYAIDENGKMFHIDIFPVQALQKTGAGDGYTSGFLSAKILGKSIEESMKWGAVNAAFVVQKIGAQPGLLAKEEIEEKLRENENFMAKEISLNDQISNYVISNQIPISE